MKCLTIFFSFALKHGNSVYLSIHCLKSVQIRSYFWSVFSCIRTEYRKRRTRNKSVFGQFSHSDHQTFGRFLLLFYACFLSHFFLTCTVRKQALNVLHLNKYAWKFFCARNFLGIRCIQPLQLIAETATGGIL